MRTIQLIRIEYHWYGIIETPCFPAMYYAGRVVLHNGEYFPARNDNYFRTLTDAQRQLKKEIQIAKGE